MTIYAAGAILWREEKGKLMVALIHRSRHDDWSWPKGKVDPGELLPETAVREIEEETGLRVKLGPFLKTMHYNVPSGTPKEVHYWSARVTDAALAKSTFKPTEEVARVDWKTAEEARALLTYAMDHEVLDKFLSIYKQGNHRTKAVIILRHAKATPRADWKGGKNVDDGHRPLLPEGLIQAQRLINLIGAFAPKRLVTSPWVRCLTTISPYAKRMKLNVIQRSQLSELGNKKGPRRTKKVVTDVIKDYRTTLICSHRPALPTIFETLSKYASGDFVEILADGVTLKPAEMMVVHLTSDEKGKRKKVVAVERYGVV